MGKILFVIVFIAVFLPLTLFKNSSFAQTQRADFSVDQTSFLIQTSKDKQITENVLIKNTSSTILRLQASWQGYSLPKGNAVSDLAITQHSVDFASIDQTLIEIEPGGIALVTVNFNVPDKINSGDYYGSLVLSNSNARQEVEFVVRVLGSLNEKLSLRNITKQSSEIVLVIANEGNRESKVFANIKIRDILGEISNTKTDTVSIRAGEIKTLRVGQKILLPGFYQAEITLAQGEKEITTTYLYSFWSGLEIIALAGFLVVILIGFIFFKKRGKTWLKD